MTTPIRASIVALAHEPDDWCSPTNRVLGNVAKYLLEHDVDPDVVYEAISAGYNASGDLP